MKNIFKSKEQIRELVTALGAKLTRVLQQKSEGYPLFICAEEDAFVFFSDLIRTIPLDIHCDFIHKEKTEAFLKGEADLVAALEGKIVVFVTLNLGRWQHALKPAPEALRNLGAQAGAQAVWLVEFCTLEGQEAFTDFHALKIPRVAMSAAGPGAGSSIDFFESLSGYGLGADFSKEVFVS